MNILSKVTWKAMWKNRTRTIVTIIGVVLSAALFTAVVTAAVSGIDFLFRGTIYENGDYHVAVHCMTAAEAEALRSDEDISAYVDYRGLGYFFFTPTSMPTMLAAVDEAFFESMPIRVKEGCLPQNSDEILLPTFYLSAFEQYGYPTQVGQIITLDFSTYYDDFFYEFPVEERTFTQTYTIVGIADYDLPIWDTRWLPTMFTMVDENVADAMWHYGYVKLKNPGDAYTFSGYGLETQPNQGLLPLLGQTKAGNLNLVIWGIVAALCAVIMIGSVSLIYNAFSISITERTKQFGLMSSVGATKKQLRNSVLFEAIGVSAIGIPLGLLVGLGGSAVVLDFSGGYIEDLFSYSSQGPIRMEIVISLYSVFVAASIGLVTVMISAWIPSCRSTKVSPLEAIRQTEDYQVKPKQAKGGKWLYRISGLPGMLAKKYYSVSRKKYRATVISLTLSLILFLFAAGVGTSLRSFAESQANTENFDLSVSLYFLEDQREWERLRNLPGVEKAAYVTQGAQYLALVTDKMYTQEMLDGWNKIYNGWPVEISKNTRSIDMYYLEDEVLQKYLVDHGIDPDPYFDSDNPMMLVCNLYTASPYVEVDGEWIQYTYSNLQVLADEVKELPLFEQDIPDALQPHPDGFYSSKYSISASGELMVTVIENIDVFHADGTVSVEENIVGQYVLRQERASEGTQYNFYAYDTDAGVVAETPSATEIYDVPQIRLGARIGELPFGLNTQYTTNYAYGITLIGAISVAPQGDRDSIPELALRVSDYLAVKTELEMTGILYEDYLAEEQNTRGMVVVINLFSYCFLGIITAICAANVFNTISTNIALRRRDFGMLKSIGMKVGDIRKMIVLECLIYGGKALLWGLPIGVLLDWLVFMVTNHAIITSYTLPWISICIGAGCILLVVFVSMLYATRKLTKENPIEAIRQENI